MKFPNDDPIRSYMGWTRRAIELLKQLPPWTAIVDRPGAGFFVLLDGMLCAVPRSTDPAHVYTADEAIPIGSQDWSGQAWDGMQADDCQEILQAPAFADLPNASAEDSEAMHL